MAAAITDLMDRVTDSTTGRPVITALSSPGKAIAAASINIDDPTNWTSTTAIHFTIYKTITVAGVTVKDTTSQTDWKGTRSGSTISNLTLTGGTDRAYVAGDIVEITPTARWAKDLYDLLASFVDQTGALLPAAVQAALNLGASSLNGWNPLGATPNTVTHNGNRSYSLVFNAADYTGTITPGMRLRTTRTVAAPNQCTSLNGTTQYFSDSSVNGMTFTDDFTVSVWVKLSSYPASEGVIASRYNGTSGWEIKTISNGQVQLVGYNGGGGNNSYVQSYQSIPLNKWVHITAQLDMSAFTATTTTSYVMIDGVDVPASVTRNGTNPTALVQAGNLEIGSRNGGLVPFPGKIAQVAIYSAKVTQATIKASMNQALAGTETSLVSGYSFNNTLNDLNTTNANNLTASGAAVATNADSPFGGSGLGTISTTQDYAIVMSSSFSTNTTLVVQVPEGCTIPTSGGIASVVYSSDGAPYNFPRDRDKWMISMINKTDAFQAAATNNVWYNLSSQMLTVPIGSWKLKTQVTIYRSSTGSVKVTMSTSSSSETDNEATAYIEHPSTAISGTIYREVYKALSVATPFYLNTISDTGAANIYNFGGRATTLLQAENGYL